MLRVATVNVNGIRAARRRGMDAWLEARHPDILCLQEVRADDTILADLVGPGWHIVHEAGAAKGRAGVAILSRIVPTAVRTGLGDFTGTGRWVEADFALESDPGLLTVASVYVHTGEADTPIQEEKYRFLATIRERMTKLAADGRHLLVCGDLNICHREVDLKNWKGNLKKAGFLPRERAWLDQLFTEDRFVDLVRKATGEQPGPYTWWSWRGKAFDTDTGWRIDYLISSTHLARRLLATAVDRAPTYDQRWSDHAPIYADLDTRTSGTPPTINTAGDGKDALHAR
ncbi:exodeoxyribonuclease III [Frankia sp. AgPm24]|uniref:exodeoxyribonuclease III n=1 Tax=Frankia sp. AgPm24 TaxID=631128 RepID=UPI00200CCC4D|nr:exodeoxyribonuclease III [Frankia sp. AgPm24]MCK9921831.1 exodeoxyribonuclease III [Frankia sp. AgPm24]